MADNTATVDVEKKLRTAIDRDGLLDLFVGSALVLTAGLAFMGWRVMGNPAVFASFAPLFVVLFFETTRKKVTYPRLGCPDYQPVQEKRFALVALSILAVLGLVVFMVTAMVSVRALRPFFEHAPAWAALFGSGMLVVLAWWYRSRRFLLYIVVSALAVVAGYLVGSHMLVRLAVLGGAVGLAMTAGGAVLLGRFLRSFPRVQDAGSLRQP